MFGQWLCWSTHPVDHGIKALIKLVTNRSQLIWILCAPFFDQGWCALVQLEWLVPTPSSKLMQLDSSGVAHPWMAAAHAIRSGRTVFLLKFSCRDQEAKMHRLKPHWSESKLNAAARHFCLLGSLLENMNMSAMFTWAKCLHFGSSELDHRIKSRKIPFASYSHLFEQCLDQRWLCLPVLPMKALTTPWRSSHGYYGMPRTSSWRRVPREYRHPSFLPIVSRRETGWVCANRWPVGTAGIWSICRGTGFWPRCNLGSYIHLPRSQIKKCWLLLFGSCLMSPLR